MHDIDHVITHQTSARAIRKGMAAVALVEELEAGRIRPGETIALIALASFC
jgi:3-oxoacyl-[acyl-carrier-protein] synthase III